MTRSLAALAVVLVLSGCANVLRSSASCPCAMPPASWTTVLREADQLAEEGRFAAADSAFVAFGEANTSSHFAREIVFWRALYQLDPRNPSGQRESASRMLDEYLQSDSVYWYRAEARVLRQLAGMPAAAPAPATAGSVPHPNGLPAPTTVPIARAADATLTEKDVEIQALRERVARLNEELERIKRRLSAP
ncbi:MAG TPA: hypothetical protein VMM17_08270 [Gemmatimonadaceae bacterium]|nr:hypothetical protein [Gemmatimonadaceae bacterium]